MSVADKLLQVNQVKQDIKTAIENKGVAMSGVPFTNYPLKISEISGGGGVDVYSMLISEGLNYYKVIAKSLYITYNKDNLFEDAWEHSLTVDPLEISENSAYGNPRGIPQYPNGETEGVIIPQGVTSIGQLAFQYWPAYNQPLVIPNSVTSIVAGAFSYWPAYNQPLVIPNSVTSIGNNAFSDWRANTHPLVIPNSVTSMGEYAFGFWGLVPYVEMKGTTPPTLRDNNTFDGQNNAPIYVPDESVTAYKTATNWISFASRIFSINDK